MGLATSLNQHHNTDVNIKLDRTSHLFLPGETVSGTVVFDQSRRRNGVISIDLIGEVAYKITNSSGKGATSTTRYRLPFFKVSKASIRDGEHFDLSLDENLPPSVNLRKGVYPYIRYLLQVNLSKTKTHRHWIIVCPRAVIPRSTIHPVYFNAFNKKEMNLKGSIDLEWILPGQKFQIEFHINNPGHEHIKYMDGSIIMRARFSGTEYSEKVMDIIIDNVHDTSDEQISDLIPLVFPFNYYPPTSNYNKQTLHVTIEYSVILAVHIKGALHTLKTSVPLAVGFEPEKIAFNEVSVADQKRTRHFHGTRIF
jgi:hypothetical protein